MKVAKKLAVKSTAKLATRLRSAKLAKTSVTRHIRSARHASRSTPFVVVAKEFCTTRVETFALHASRSVLLVNVDARFYTTKKALCARHVLRHLNGSQHATPKAVWDVVHMVLKKEINK
jgi:hypothetical protein